ncbi:efflux RND transporter periplasmic adaptor subunit [Streptomyces tsukubensis]|uniref:efflux RND transporter periplasmic adaptor subunit n=1 Tax=Streptomyces tsukubensis TaxID=83656 RepID=UPI0036965213
MLDSEATTPVPQVEAEREEERAPAPRRRRGLRAVIGGTTVLAVGAAGTFLVVRDDQGSSSQDSSSLPTATVTRTDLVNTSDVDGTLGYEGSSTVLGPGGGRITWLPEGGDVVKRGQRVYAVDSRDVPLFYGSTPFWRELKTEVTKGVDVLELERNLKALGYGDGLAVDRLFTWRTEEAVKKWQKDLGVKQTGIVKPDDVTVQRGAIRVTKVQAVLGAPAGGTVLTGSGTARLVTVNLPVGDQSMARKGAKVRITLPGGKQTTGRISAVGTVATAGTTNSDSQTGEGTENATIPVYVTLDKPASAGTLDSAPATVGFTSTERKNVLAVPVNALLASSEGTYSVKVVDSSGDARSVPVKLGVFDGNKVEVQGSLTPGQKVQVPRS